MAQEQHPVPHAMRNPGGSSRDSGSPPPSKRKRSRRPVGILIAAGYTLVHLLMSREALRRLARGEGGAAGAAREGAFLAFEVFNLLVPGSMLLDSARLRLSEETMTDLSLLMLALMNPLFQVVLLLTHPTAVVEVHKNWPAFVAFLMGLGVLLKGFPPAHSLVQFLSSVPLLVFAECYRSSYRAQLYGGPAPSWAALARVAAHNLLSIGAAALFSWVVTYIIIRKHSSRLRQSEATQRNDASVSSTGRVTPAGSAAGNATPSRSGRPPPHSGRLARAGGQGTPGKAAAAAAAAVAGAAQQQKGARQGQEKQQGQGQEKQQGQEKVGDLGPGKARRMSGGAAAAGEAPPPAAAAAAAPAAAAAGGGSLSSVLCPPSALPFEHLGFRGLAALGLGPALHGFEAWATNAADRVDELLVMFFVCLPVGAYSLAFALLCRLNFQNFSMQSVSPDTFLLYIAVWFMLGRFSCSFDLLPLMHQIQSQLRASFAKPADKPSLSELVDRIRQQVMGANADDPGGQGIVDSGNGAEEIKLLELLGEGTFGKVFKGLWRGTTVAVKSMVLMGHLGGAVRRGRMAILEAAISSTLSHPNIVQTYTYSVQPLRDARFRAQDVAQEGAASGDAAQWSDEGTPGRGESPGASGGGAGFEVRLVLEYADCGTLRDALDRVRLGVPFRRVDYRAVLDTAADIAKGMLHLHALNVVHSDLKARNVLLLSSASDPRGFTAKVSDFGLSLKMDASETHVSNLYHGTPTHMAPEVLMQGYQSKAADVFAFGISMWEIFTASLPFQGVAPAMLGHHVATRGERPAFPPDAPRAYVALAARCWHPNPNARPSFEDIVARLAELREAEEGPTPRVPAFLCEEPVPEEAARWPPQALGNASAAPGAAVAVMAGVAPAAGRQQQQQEQGQQRGHEREEEGRQGSGAVGLGTYEALSGLVMMPLDESTAGRDQGVAGEEGGEGAGKGRQGGWGMAAAPARAVWQGAAADEPRARPDTAGVGGVVVGADSGCDALKLASAIILTPMDESRG